MRSNKLTDFFEVIDFQSNPFTYACFFQILGVLLNKIISSSVIPILSVVFSPGNEAKYLFNSIKISAYSPTFKLSGFFNPHGFLVPRRITRFCLDNALIRKKYALETRTTQFKCTVVLLPTWSHKVSNFRRDYPHNIVCGYFIFTLATSVPTASSVILKFHMNNKNSSGLPLSKKAILN